MSALKPARSRRRAFGIALASLPSLNYPPPPARGIASLDNDEGRRTRAYSTLSDRDDAHQDRYGAADGCSEKDDAMKVVFARVPSLSSVTCRS